MELFVIFTLLYSWGGPLAIGTWVGTFGRRPSTAFGLGWIATPIAGIVLNALLLFVLLPAVLRTNANQAPEWQSLLIGSLVSGSLFGLMAGGLAAWIVGRRTSHGTVGPPDTPPV